MYSFSLILSPSLSFSDDLFFSVSLSVPPTSSFPPLSLSFQTQLGFSNGQFFLSLLGTNSTEFGQLQESAMRNELFTCGTFVLTDNANRCIRICSRLDRLAEWNSWTQQWVSVRDNNVTLHGMPFLRHEKPNKKQRCLRNTVTQGKWTTHVQKHARERGTAKQMT